MGQEEGQEKCQKAAREKAREKGQKAAREAAGDRVFVCSRVGGGKIDKIEEALRIAGYTSATSFFDSADSVSADSMSSSSI